MANAVRSSRGNRRCPNGSSRPPADAESPLPTQRGDTGIGRECLSSELQPPLGKLAHGAGAVRVQIETPGLPLQRLAPCEGTAREQCDVDASRITRGSVEQDVDIRFACAVGQ